MSTQSTCCPVRRVTQGPKHHFFGYYDKCPWDRTGQYLLTVEAGFNDRMPTPDDAATIGLVDLRGKTGHVAPLAETRAWNWQQGAMLQWLESGNGRQIVFNDREGDALVSVLYDVESGKRRTLPLPVYAVSRDGTRALSVSFPRLHRWRPGYGYVGSHDSFVEHPAPQEDGVYLLDLTSGDARMILSYETIRCFQHHSIMNRGAHWVEHLMFNDDDTRFLFLHRFTLPDQGHYTRLMTANPDGTELHLLHEGMISHLCWKDSSHILAWARPRLTLSQIRRTNLLRSSMMRPVLAWIRRQHRGWLRRKVMGDCYMLFRDRSRQADPIAVGVLNEDGHCTFRPSGDWILADTYPDEQSQQAVVVYHTASARRLDICRLYAPISNSPIRCDLHPRWNREGTEVCIDSLHDGSRQIYVLDLRDLLS